MSESIKIQYKSVKRGKSLREWCEENPERGQQLLQEFTGITEEGIKQYTPESINYASNKKLLWRCSKGHEWFAIVSNCLYKISLHEKCLEYCQLNSYYAIIFIKKGVWQLWEILLQIISTGFMIRMNLQSLLKR